MRLYYVTLLFIVSQRVIRSKPFPLLNANKGCTIDVKVTEADHDPIFANATTLQFLYPSDGSISLKQNQEILIGCPGSGLTGLKYTPTVLKASCISGSEFNVSGIIVSISNLACAQKQKETIKLTGNSCNSSGKEIVIGFDLGSYFIPQIFICFDVTNSNALYSSYTITKHIGEYQTGVPRPDFNQDTFYPTGTDVNKLYLRQTQRSSINNQLGLPLDSTQYIKDDKSFFLSRGHLAPKAAFFYASQQSATFHYVNSAPQWQTFNGKNWNEIEISVRNYAARNRVDLVVYTGTSEICTLPHSQTGSDIPLYLESTKKLLSVPKYYWKLVYEPIGKRGVVLVGVNNPYIKSSKEYVFCSDVSSKLGWLSWSPSDIEAGYSFACEVNEFKTSVSLPDFEVNELLLGSGTHRRCLSFLITLGTIVVYLYQGF